MPVDGVKYHVSTSHDLASKTISIIDAHKQLAFTEYRALVGEETVNTLFDAQKRPTFELHKPIRGWYMVIRPASQQQSAPFVQVKPSRESRNLEFRLASGVFSPQTDRGEAQFLLQPRLPHHEKRKSFGLGHVTSLFANRHNTFSLILASPSKSDEEVLRFEDTTGMLSNASSGELFVNEQLISELGLAPLSFYISVALAFLEYLEDEAAFKAANEDIAH